jgi:hypothetical protein
MMSSAQIEARCEPKDVGLLGIPPLALEPFTLVSATPPINRGLMQELKIVVLVLAVAIAASALVAAIGIALTA